MLSGAERCVVQRGVERAAEDYCTDIPYYSLSLKTENVLFGVRLYQDKQMKRSCLIELLHTAFHAGQFDTQSYQALLSWSSS